MLLLDEPTNHLDAESVAWLERFLEEFPGTVIAVTHDRYFLDNVCGWILELDRGMGIPWEGNYSSWLEQKEKRLEQEEKQQSAHRKSMAAELEWVRQNPKGRQAKSKARLARFEELSSQEFQKRNETNEIYIPPGPRLGDVVVELDTLRNANVVVRDAVNNGPNGQFVYVVTPEMTAKETPVKVLFDDGTHAAITGSIEPGDRVVTNGQLRVIPGGKVRIGGGGAGAGRGEGNSEGRGRGRGGEG
jgi:ATPase subunit of ABC transporter with duplicated ATPase domains